MKRARPSYPRVALRGDEVAHEPVAGQGGGALERARLLEEVRGAGYYLEPARAEQPCPCSLVQLEDPHVAPAHDQQRRRLDPCEALGGQVRPCLLYTSDAADDSIRV